MVIGGWFLQEILSGFVLRMEADAFSRWSRRGRRWIENQHQFLKHVNDGCFVRIKASSELLFQSSKFLGKVTCAQQGLAHLDESANDKHAHLHCAGAVQDIGGLEGAMLGESVGAILPVLTPAFL